MDFALLFGACVFVCVCLVSACIRVSTLRQLHNARCSVNFKEGEIAKQENDIVILTHSITGKLQKCESDIRRISLVRDATRLNAQERTVRLNSMRLLAQHIQLQNKNFRHVQKDFLKALNNQQSLNRTFRSAEAEDGMDESHLHGGLQLDEINLCSNEREKEIIRVAKSVHELSVLSSELNVLVIGHGTVLDRIDYNLEETLVKVRSGHMELTEAEKHSRRTLTCRCIVVLLIIVVILIGILVWKKM